MKRNLETVIRDIASTRVVDLLFTPFVFVSAVILFIVRLIGVQRLPISKKVLLKVGIMPVRNHYYEPLFDKRNLYKPLSENRLLPGINWNIDEQISILNSFTTADEMKSIPDNFVDELTFSFRNNAFEYGDAEYWYNLIRLKKPKKIVEIGCGNSTKMAQLAIRKNKGEDEGYNCEHICIEPYEMPWLEKLNIRIIRERVENVDKEIFRSLGKDDILFIDSSHVIRPQGDVLFEYLELLPTLNPGVIVHVHDIFSPKDYPEEWIMDEVRFWNEQYLLEAFLTSNSDWKIIGAINYLHHNHSALLQDKCPRLRPEHKPGSFYIQKLG